MRTESNVDMKRNGKNNKKYHTKQQQKRTATITYEYELIETDAKEQQTLLKRICKPKPFMLFP